MGALEPFAKLFDTPDGQILVTIDWDDDDEKDVVNIRAAARHGIVPAMKLGGWPEDEAGARNAFDAIGQAEADKQARSFAAMIDSLIAERAKDDAK